MNLARLYYLLLHLHFYFFFFSSLSNNEKFFNNWQHSDTFFLVYFAVQTNTDKIFIVWSNNLHYMYGHSHIYYSLIWTLILRFCFFTFNFRLINKTQFFVWLFKFTLVTQLPEIIQTQKNSENCKINYELIGIIKKVLQQKIIS